MVDRDTRWNFITYLMNFAVVAAIGLWVNPLLLAGLGPIMFGVWKSLQRFLDFATLADGRASQALKWIVASRTTFSEYEKRQDVGAAVIVWIRWLPAAILLATGVAVATPILINGVPVSEKAVVFTTAAILALSTVLSGLLLIPDSVLVGVNQGYRTVSISTIAFVISNIALVVAVSKSWPLWSLALIVASTGIGNALVTFLVAKRFLPWFGISRPARSDVKRVLNYSTWTLGNGVVDKLLLSSEFIVISIVLGAAYITQYTFTTYLMQFVLSMALVSAAAFMPTLGSRLGSSQIQGAAEWARSVRHLVFGLSVVGSGAMLAFNDAFVTIWVGADQYLGTVLNVLLVLGGLQQALIRMDGQVLDVTMRIAPKVIIGAISAVGGIAAGFIGFAISSSVVVMLCCIIAFRLISSVAYPLLVARSIPGSKLPRRAVITGGALMGISHLIAQLIQGSEPLKGIVYVAVWLIVAGTATWAGLLPRATLRALLAK